MCLYYIHDCKLMIFMHTYSASVMKLNVVNGGEGPTGLRGNALHAKDMARDCSEHAQ